jgi:hypothetical protein
MKPIKVKLKHRIRVYIDFLRQRTPHFNEQVKHLIWGTGPATDKKSSVPKLIWLYWHDEQIASATVQLCIDHIRHLHPDFEVNLLNRGNLSSFLPDFPSALLEKPANFVSDMVRLMLLEKHGGIYLDATVLLAKKLDWATALQQTDQSEAVLYYTDENTRHANYPMVETWFIAAVPQSKFIAAWRKAYQDCMLSKDPEKFYENDPVFAAADFPLDPSYYVSYMAGQMVMRTNQHYRLSLLRAEDEAFLYGLGFKKKWNEVAMAEVLLLNKRPNPIPNLIKLIRFDRRRLDLYLQKGFFNEDSWLGGLVGEKTND